MKHIVLRFFQLIIIGLLSIIPTTAIHYLFPSFVTNLDTFTLFIKGGVVGSMGIFIIALVFDYFRSFENENDEEDYK